MATQSNKPLYRQIYDAIAAEIHSGALQPGQRVPSENEVAAHHDVSRITSKRALELLAQQGLITRIAGKGSFVTAQTDRDGKPSLSRHAHLIGLIMEDFSDAFGKQIVCAVEEFCYTHGYRLVLYRSQWDIKREEHAIRDALEVGVEGLIIMPVHGEYYPEIYLKLLLEGFPLVFIDRCLPGLKASYVGTDNIEAAYQAVKYLFSLGHRAIALATPPLSSASTIRDREIGFTKAHAECDSVTEKQVWITDITGVNARSEQKTEETVELLKERLIAAPHVTAVLCEEEAVCELVQRALGELEKIVPQDISLFSFDGHHFTDGAHQRFTHLRQQEKEMGFNAAEVLHGHIRGERKVSVVKLPALLVEGRSVRDLTK